MPRIGQQHLAALYAGIDQLESRPRLGLRLTEHLAKTFFHQRPQGGLPLLGQVLGGLKQGICQIDGGLHMGTHTAVDGCIVANFLRAWFLPVNHAVALKVSPSAFTSRSISARVLMKGGASWMVSPP